MFFRQIDSEKDFGLCNVAIVLAYNSRTLIVNFHHCCFGVSSCHAVDVHTNSYNEVHGGLVVVMHDDIES